MGVLDRFLQAAPGLYAQAKAGQQAGYDRRQEQLRQNEADQKAAEQAALQQMILQSRMQEDQQTAPYRRRLLEARTGEAEARAADFGAQVAGTGRYAKTPVEKKWILKPDHRRGGLLVAVDPETGLDRDGKPVYEREPASRVPSDPTPNRANYVARRAILLLKERDMSNPYASAPKYRTLAEAKQAAADEYDTLYGEGDGPGTPTSPPPIRDFFGAVGTAQSGTKPPTTEPDEDADPDFAELERQYQANKRKP